MKRNTILQWIIGAAAFATLACALIANLGATRREYECAICHSRGEATVTTLCKHRIWTSELTAVTTAIAVRPCKHLWVPFYLQQCSIALPDQGDEEKMRSQILAAGQGETPRLNSVAIRVNKTTANNMPQDTAHKLADPEH